MYYYLLQTYILKTNVVCHTKGSLLDFFLLSDTNFGLGAYPKQRDFVPRQAISSSPRVTGATRQCSRCKVSHVDHTQRLYASLPYLLLLVIVSHLVLSSKLCMFRPVSSHVVYLYQSCSNNNVCLI